jgi:hypothetical protein
LDPGWIRAISVGDEELGESVYQAGLQRIACKLDDDGQRITSLVVCRGTGWILVCDLITRYVDRYPIFIEGTKGEADR